MTEKEVKQKILEKMKEIAKIAHDFAGESDDFWVRVVVNDRVDNGRYMHINIYDYSSNKDFLDGHIITQREDA